MSTHVTRRQAEAALQAVRHQFATYLQPLHLPAETLPDGTVSAALDLPPACPEPKLDMDWSGYVAILWEDGPSDWAYRATMGGSSEEDRSLVAAANAEFGGNARVQDDDPISWPKGVTAEPYYSFVLTLYPA